ncbi:hypothetical protein DEO72_LG2g3190 [Vigna unguiculata]|uniref:Homologous recombination OB-fold protein OB-fold domain-containing protein n=1 Tax=Vigna unguiculata TaxID=3917 RepID=A0A4D6L2Y0_VIGUN|nr:hypothetical protein DEO72_LG2g3190 [Vigna unguiculata]
MEPWKGIDVEEQDLESFLKKCNSSTTLIPGLAGNVQAAIIDRGIKHAQSTQEFARAIVVATYERDFKSNAWLWAEKFIKFHEQDPTGTVWASVHRQVLLHPEYGRDFNVGAVLLLNTQVATFNHRHKICYLNINVRNIVKIFKADICEPTDELVQATMKPIIEPHPSLDPKVQDILKRIWIRPLSLFMLTFGRPPPTLNLPKIWKHKCQKWGYFI